MSLLRLFVLVAGAVLWAALPAFAFETRARAAWVYDMTTGTVLMAKNAEAPLPPASMSKLMTLNMLFEALKDGRVRLDEPFAVSSRARSMGGSSMFLTEKDRPTVEELIKGIIVLSGNDACVVVAEGLAGTEEAFAQKMNERARALGLTASHFVNSTGWPAEGHVMSMHDLGRLAVRLITEFPEYYGYFSLTEFAFDGRTPDNRFNRNPLLGLGIGADGLKTGHTTEAGYGMVGSAQQGGRRVVMVIAGLPDAQARAEEAEKVMTWAFREFAMKSVAKKGTRLAEAPVFMGEAPTVGLIPAEDARILLPSLAQDTLEAEVVYSGPVMAPVRAGDRIADLVVQVPGNDPVTIPLVAEADVGRGGFLTRMTTAFGVLTGRMTAMVGS
ncbi:MAG: D-alanyl-D-alanine carboxypeptidase [Rhodobacteraceae bacterium]|nr:D-alanyl-D-alanine carboxypeptidase [Paracoccaceae bacterium]